MVEGRKITEYRKRCGLSQKELAQMLHVTAGAVSQWEHDSTTPQMEFIVAMSKIFGVNISTLVNNEDEHISNSVPLRTVPVLGRIACGTPIEEIPENDEHIQIPQKSKADFALVCAGDSMAPNIQPDDYILIRRQPDVENGQIAAVEIRDGGTSEATLKRVYHVTGGLLLVADNHTYPPIMAQRVDVKIIGLAVGLHRELV